VLSDIEAILFDLGDTLVSYPVPRWPIMARRCLAGVYGYLVRPEAELPPPAAAVPGPEEARARRAVPGPDTALPHRVMLALRRVVRSISGRTLPRMAEACTRPLVADGRLFADALPTILALRGRGYRLGLVSNTPWGTPDYLWERQVERFALAPHFEVRIFSSVIGFRKPDARIFKAALQRLGVAAGRTLFVGNDPQADIEGAQDAGLRAALIARPGYDTAAAANVRPDLRVRTLTELLAHLPGPAKIG